MTKIKLCGLSRVDDIIAANRLRPDYIGFVFFEKSKRNVTPEQAAALKAKLEDGIKAVGVFVSSPIDFVASLLEQGIIDAAQLHGKEDEAYIAELRKRTDKPIFQAFVVKSEEDVQRANASTADMVLLDSGIGSGNCFDWQLLSAVKRPFFLAGGLNPENIEEALTVVDPYGVDVSSGIETGNFKDEKKMETFVEKVRDNRREE
ncbi:MAG: phosphoribosylanthranilate isomerase [Acetatifactor sp.]|nr:phosphoribosylanthranilate isomerase [Acetatifactor sp.]